MTALRFLRLPMGTSVLPHYATKLTTLVERLSPVAPPRSTAASNARRISEVVKSRPSRPTLRPATFPNKSNHLRNLAATGAALLSSRGSTDASTLFNNTHKQHTNRTPNTNTKRHANDNAEQQRQANHTTPKAKIAARVLSYYRRLQASAGNYGVFVFTLNIDQKLLVGRKNPSTWMQHRIARHLKELLSRDVIFVGVMEWRRKLGNELHLHGVILL
jgi:hypothetical protein